MLGSVSVTASWIRNCFIQFLLVVSGRGLCSLQTLHRWHSVWKYGYAEVPTFPNLIFDSGFYNDTDIFLHTIQQKNSAILHQKFAKLKAHQNDVPSPQHYISLTILSK